MENSKGFRAYQTNERDHPTKYPQTNYLLLIIQMHSYSYSSYMYLLNANELNTLEQKLRIWRSGTK